MIIKRVILVAFLIGLILTFGLDTLTQDTPQLRQKAIEFLRAKKYEEAISVYQQILQENPNDEIALYNTACAYSLWKKKEEAVEYLKKAVEAGFTDFEHIESDPDLKNIRRHSEYRKLIRQKDEIIENAAKKKIEQLKKEFGEGYTYEIDEKRKLIYASKTSKELLERIKKFLNRYADAMRRYIFTNKPTYYITILCPTIEDFRKRVPDPSVGGFYRPGTRTLICKDTGYVLRHEFTHALHLADLAARKQAHPIWIVEGLATCFEHSEILHSAKVVSEYNPRIDQVKKVIREGKGYIPWQNLMKMDHGSFMKKASICYAEARAIFYWLNHTRKLKSFYRWHIRYAEDDPSGIKAMEILFREKLEKIEETWKEWIVKAKPPRVLEDKKGTFLGVQVEASVAGMIITHIVPGSAAEEAGLKVDDVILKIGSDKITSYLEFTNAIRKRRPGQKVNFYILRGDQELKIRVEMGEREE